MSMIDLCASVKKVYKECVKTFCEKKCINSMLWGETDLTPEYIRN